MAKRNAAIYGVLDKIEFIVGDFFKLGNQVKGDVMVTSPPWGGPEYNKMDVIRPLDLCMDKILEVGKTIAPKILLHLPKNLDKNEVCTSFIINCYYLCGTIIYILNVYSVGKCAAELVPAYGRSKMYLWTGTSTRCCYISDPIM